MGGKISTLLNRDFPFSAEGSWHLTKLPWKWESTGFLFQPPYKFKTGFLRFLNNINNEVIDNDLYPRLSPLALTFHLGSYKVPLF